MDCLWCSTGNRAGAVRCSACGRPLVALDASQRARRRASDPTPPETELAPTQPIPLPPPPPPAAPSQTAEWAPPPPTAPIAEPSPVGDRSRAPRALFAVALLALAVAGAALVATLVRSSDGDVGNAGFEPAVQTTISAAPTTTPTTPAPTSPATVPATTAAPATTLAPPTTLAPTTTAPMPPPPAPTAPPPTPEPTPEATVTGLVNVLEDPLPSGVPVAEVEPSLQAAQQLADALANDDWPAARRLDPGLASMSDEQFVDGFEGLDRSTLLLVDARRVGEGHDLLAALIANERGGRQTTLYCVESTVTGDGEVRQRTANLLGRASRTLGIDDVRQDATIVEQIRRQCVWG